MRNRLYIGTPSGTLGTIEHGTIDLMWGDLRAAILRPTVPDVQLSLFEPAASAHVVEASDASRLSLVDLLARYAKVLLRPTGFLLFLCEHSVSHRIRLAAAEVLGDGLFQTELLIRSKFNSRPSELPGYSVIIFGASREASFYGLQSQRRVSDIRWEVPAGDKEGRAFRLADCVHPVHNANRESYEWNGSVRPWRWPREEMQRLHDAGLLVYTRGGLPRLKRFLDEITARRAVAGATDLADAYVDRGGPNEIALRYFIERCSQSDGTLLDVTCRSSRMLRLAQSLGRKWVAIPRSYDDALQVSNELRESPDTRETWSEVVFGPRTWKEAGVLATSSPREFTAWVLAMLGARPNDRLRAQDAFVDGWLSPPGAGVSIPIVVKTKDPTEKDLVAVRRALRTTGERVGVVVTPGDHVAPTRITRDSAVVVVPVRRLLERRRYELLLDLDQRARRAPAKARIAAHSGRRNRRPA